MSSEVDRRALVWLQDILTEAAFLDETLGAKRLKEYQDDPLLVRAVERSLVVISEAVVRVGPVLTADLLPSAPFEDLRNLGNHIRHGYDRLDQKKLFEVATEHVRELANDASTGIQMLKGRSGFVPTMALAAVRRFPSLLFDALADTGFVVITDHGIDLSRLHAAYAAVEAFFALPEDEKRAYMVGRDGQRGYTPFGREHAKDADAPDLKEFWHVGRDAIAPNVWPERPEAFEREVAWLYDALDALGLELLRALTGPLGVPADTFDEMAAGGNSVLRLLHYPPLSEDADPRSIRAAAHEDINLITLLVSASAAGLELQDREGRWHAIDAPPDSVIVDSGDMLARITNGALPSTTHRVVNPEGPNSSRYSMPFFLHPRPDAVLSVFDRYGDGSEADDVTAGAFLRQRLEEIGLK